MKFAVIPVVEPCRKAVPEARHKQQWYRVRLNLIGEFNNFPHLLIYGHCRGRTCLNTQHPRRVYSLGHYRAPSDTDRGENFLLQLYMDAAVFIPRAPVLAAGMASWTDNASGMQRVLSLTFLRGGISPWLG